jgi:AraC family transcriptional regulator
VTEIDAPVVSLRFIVAEPQEAKVHRQPACVDKMAITQHGCRENSQSAWRGSVFLWNERGFYLGAASDTCMHAPHAIKVCIAAHGNFRLHSGIDGSWSSYQAAIVAPDYPHRLDGRGAILGLFYLIPEAVEARRILDGHFKQSISPIAQGTIETLLPRLRRYLDQGCSGEEASELFDHLVKHLSPSTTSRPALEPRVSLALEYLRSTTDHRATVTEIAAAVSLSPSRLAHLFRASAGLPIRRYQLWLRLRSAIERMAGHASLTETAHAAGFADSAHLSRTFRRMMGLAPSDLLRNSRFIQGQR